MSDVEALLASLAAGIPPLRGAACVGHSHLFDAAEDDETRASAQHRFAAALELCRTCGCLAACRAWLESLPVKRRPAGVVAAPTVRPGIKPGRIRCA